MKKTITTIFLLLILSGISITGQIQLSDSAKISLMTVSPWTGAAYSLYGHTVLKVEDDSTGVDACFNYGYFDSSQPNFIYHFVRGETDYVLGATSYQEFISENKMKGLEVIEQELNLSVNQKQKLWEDLYINALPENRKYRYNYFFDNCATRPRDMIETVVDKTIVYPDTKEDETFRDFIHECVHEFAWMQFGIDLLIGADADKNMTKREKMFLPFHLMKAFEGANIKNNDSADTPLVKSTEIILASDKQDNNVSELGFLNPLPVSFALLIISLTVSFLHIRFKIKRLPQIYDTLLFLLAGLAGSIITFLVFFSEHPATSPNWNLAWLHIFHLIFALLFWVKSAEKIVYYYHFINFAVLSIFILSWWFLPQQLPFASIPIALSLCLRSASNFFIRWNEYSKKKQFKTAKYMQAGWKY